MKKITLLIFCLLHVLTTYAVKITVDGITYDDHGSSTIHEGRYRNVTVVSVSSEVAGNVVIPAIPAEFSGGLFYFQVTRIASNAFRNNTRITSITIPHTVAELEDQTFGHCTGLMSAIIACSSVSDYAFYGCTNLSSVSFTENVTNTGVLQGCPALSHFEVAAQNEAYSVADGVLYNKNQTTLVRYPVGKPGNSFSIPSTVTSIGDSAFEGSRLTSIVIPQNTTTIGDWAFGDSPNLTSITIPQGITSISTSAFNACTGLTGFDAASANTAYSTADGVLYNKDKTGIVRYPPNKANTSFTIPATVGKINRYAFRDCLQLPAILVPGNVTTIDSGAFAWSRIKTITLSAKVNFINIYAFGGCSELTDITVFWNNPSEVTIAESEWPDEDVFADVDKSNVKLHVPPGTKAAYQTSEVWKDFNIIDDADVTGIANAKTDEEVTLYFDPAGNSLTISGLHGYEMIEIYTVTGQLIASQKATNETENIATDHLPASVYLVKAGNRKVLKWVKK